LLVVNSEAELININWHSVNQHRLDIEPSSDVSVASLNIEQHIQKYVDDASLLRTHGQELIFTLPLASADKFAGN